MSAGGGLTGPGRPLAPFRFPAFRALWTANLASNLGSMIQATGAAWLMTDLTASHQLIALVQASTTIPILLLAVVAGAIADNYDRRLVMLAAQAGMLTVSALLAAMAWSGAIGPYSLLACTLAVGAGTALNGPAWQASVRLQVGPGDLAQAISFNAIAFNLARSVGPALGGLLISVTSPALGFAINAVSYLALIVVLLRWRPEHPPRAGEPMLAAIRRGIAFCAGSSPVRRVLARGLHFGFCAAAFNALLPVIVRGRLHGTEIDFGVLLGAFGFGSIVTALWVAPLRRRWGSERMVSLAGLVFALAMIPLALIDSQPLLLGTALVAGSAWVATFTTLNVAMQLRSPEEILGRCLAIYQAVTFGGLALGAYATGLIADLAGVPAAILAPALLLGLGTPLLRWLAPMPAREEGRVAA